MSHFKEVRINKPSQRDDIYVQLVDHDDNVTNMTVSELIEAANLVTSSLLTDLSGPYSEETFTSVIIPGCCDD